jgi:hypothetical protein
MLKTFRAAFVTSAITAFSVTFLVSLAENDAARDGRVDPTRGRPATHAVPAMPQPGVRVIELYRAPAGEPGSRPAALERRGVGRA